MNHLLDSTCPFCNTTPMPVKNHRAKNASKKSSSIPRPALSKAYESEISYETRVIIVILLLIFIYPVGLIFMWAWMRNWPVWLKIIISLPLFFGVLAFFLGMIVLGTFLGRAQNYRLEQMQEQMRGRHELQVNPTTFPTEQMMLTPTDTPNTY